MWAILGCFEATVGVLEMFCPGAVKSAWASSAKKRTVIMIKADKKILLKHIFSSSLMCLSP
jgi:hypothetical protein